jgi:ABC-type antimicrobial peptide transport system permease subunit
MFIESLVPSEAYPISTFIIAICSCCTFYMGVKDKIENPSSNFVNYDLAIVFCPSLLLGTKFGTIFNKSLSPIILIVGLTLFVLHNIKNTYYKAHELRKKDLDALQLEPKESEFLRYTLMKDQIVYKIK